MTDTMFETATPPTDSTPELEGVEYPCLEVIDSDGTICGRESGPYGGRGPKPKRCPQHKKQSTSSGKRAPRVTGTPSNLAAQAAGVLTQLNSIMGIGMMALGLNETASALASCQDTFQAQAYDALLTDPDLCKMILRGGVQSSKVSLGLAYIGMGTVVVPTAVNEMRAKKEARQARMETEGL